MANDELIGKEFGAYRIVSKIGEGGMSQVYKARHVALGYDVAIKVLSANLSQQGNARRRFIREARSVSKLRHPNIARVHHFSQEGGRYYMVMDLVEGMTLRQRLDKTATLRRQQMSRREVLGIIGQVASALDYAHRQGVIHRDVKPSNILMSDDNVAVLTDFGIAKIVADTVQTTEGAILGTPTYMAPEQATSKKVLPQTDVYSLGIVLYEMVTGKVPFEGDTTLSIVLQHMHESPPPPSRYNKKLEPAVEQVILKALEKAPLDRFPSAGEMSEALQSAWKEEPTEIEYKPARQPAAGETPLKKKAIKAEGKPESTPTSRRLLFGVLGLALVAAVVFLLLNGGLPGSSKSGPGEPPPTQETGGPAVPTGSTRRPTATIVVLTKPTATYTPQPVATNTPTAAAYTPTAAPSPTSTGEAEKLCFTAKLEKYVTISGNMMQVEGYILDQQGNPLPGVPIRMSRPEWNFESTAWGSRPNGYYVIDGLVQEGAWKMDLPKEDSEPVSVELIPNKKAVVNWQGKPCQ